ncbi:DUF4913 domain-containing protein [Embleya sp. NBC_00896]|uniref:DUF4913 domain-containing protein n=1 Tax=Embleya sp. NBC_00896 TaxID=2975961 RepID=UPI002F9105C8|nr:DUF4913 domain-containing protein [Embleya sp. NBC_00896]
MYGVEDMLTAKARAAVEACGAASAAPRMERLAELASQWAADAGGHTVDTLAVRLIRAQTVAEAGDVLLCWELLREVAQDASRVLGRDHELTLRVRAAGSTHVAAAMAAAERKARADVARDMADAERKSRALIRDEHLRLAADTERVLGPDHPLSVSARRAAAAHTAGADRETADQDANRPAKPYASGSVSNHHVFPPARVFPSLEAFVSGYIAPIFPIDPSRDVHAWCPDWWRHPEAVVRLSAMWEAFEASGTEDPWAGLERWYRDADLHLAELRDPVSGTFSRCSPTHGHTEATAAMPTRPAPPELLRLPAFCVNADATDADVVPDVRRLVFESTEEFVVLYIASVFQSAPDDAERAWCPEWWRHAQALSRFTALWRSYEAHHADGSISDWLLYCADPHLRSLRAPDSGPFSRCSATLGHDGTLIEMPVNPPPPGFTCDERGTLMLIPPSLLADDAG